MLSSGGAAVEPASTLKALRLLSDSRVFQLGGVLIGTLAFRLSAQPLRHLDYLLEHVTQSVILGSQPVLVNLPDPGRFAIHKLWLSTRRPTAFRTKATKDILLAGQLIEVLLEDRLNDLEDAYLALPNVTARNAVLEASKKLESDIRTGFKEAISDST